MINEERYAEMLNKMTDLAIKLIDEQIAAPQVDPRKAEEIRTLMIEIPHPDAERQ